MSAGRFFVAPATLVDPTRIILPPDIASQVRAVLRLIVGDRITLLDGSGAAYAVELTELGRTQTVGRVIAVTHPSAEPRVALTLCVGLLKGPKFEWIVQKGTELGVAAFMPLRCGRSVADGSSAPKLERWRAIAAEAAEQADRTMTPTIHAPRSFAEGLQLDGMKLIAAPVTLAPDAQPLRSVAPLPAVPSESLPSHATAEETPRLTIRAALRDQQPTAVGVYIGPEGGLTPGEVAMARAAGALVVTLGPRILRAETAAIVAATLIMDALGELG